MPASYPAPGDHIGRFRVLAQLGRGGMGVVYDALEENLDRRVALKVISPMYADDADFRLRFGHEARALASLDSPHVVQVYAHGEEDGYLYIATQLIPDGDLGQMITTWGPAPVGKAVELIEQVASGLADAHAAGLVHRDIKPANVLVRRRGAGASASVAAYLGDFGIARRIDAEATRIGSAVIGTPSYMAPELHSGGQAGIASDIYSLGCLLWVTLTGSPPFPGTSEFEIVGGHVTKPVPQLIGRGSPLVESVNRILRLAMDKEPRNRYPDSATLRDELRRAALLTQDASFYLMGIAATGTQARVAPTPTPSGGLVSAPAAHPSYGGLPPTGPPTGPPARPPAYGGPLAYPTPTERPVAGRSRTRLWVALGVAAALALGGGVIAALVSGGDSGGSPGAAVQTSSDFADGTADEILQAAQKDMSDLESVRLIGEVTSDGAQLGFDLTVTSRGDCAGQITAGSGTAEFRGVDGTSYFRADEAFWKASSGESKGASVYSAIGDRWVPLAAADAEEFTALCDLDTLLEDTTDEEPTLEKVGAGEAGGTPVVKIDSTDSGGTTTAYVSVGEPHYLLQLDGGSERGSFTFSDFDVPFTVEAPPADEIADPAVLGG